MRASEVIAQMASMYDEEQRRVLMYFFKTGKGEYGEGDDFIGIRVPQTRKIAKMVSAELPLDEVTELLDSRWHEVRLCGLFAMVEKFERLATRKLETDVEATRKRDAVVRMYLENADRVNNWDLVDLTAPKIIGHWLLLPTMLGDQMEELDKLAKSCNLWHRRISMVSTLWPTQHGVSTWCLHYAEMHLGDAHDLMHKATGWMLREVGKRCGADILRDFLQQHIHVMNRTTLRYAIERFSPEERNYWMNV